MRAMPTEIGRPSSVRTRRRIIAAISATFQLGGCRPNALPIDMRSTSGVKSPITLMAASRSRWNSPKWPPTKISYGHSSRASRPDVPPRTRLAPQRPDCDEHASQRRLKQLIDRCVKCTQVGLKDRGCGCHRKPLTPPLTEIGRPRMLGTKHEQFGICSRARLRHDGC